MTTTSSLSVTAPDGEQRDSTFFSTASRLRILIPGVFLRLDWMKRCRCCLLLLQDVGEGRRDCGNQSEEDSSRLLMAQLNSKFTKTGSRQDKHQNKPSEIPFFALRCNR